MPASSAINETSQKKLPFLIRKYDCPVCRTTGRHRQFRTRVFTAGEVESDGHVTSFNWNDPQYLQVHPPLYFLYFCSACYFTAPADDFIEPDNALYGRPGHRTFQKARSERDPIITFLGRKIDYENITFETALWMHLLAIYILLLADEKLRDHLTIGRLYLRVAWLYREEARESEQAATTNEETPEESAGDRTAKAVVAALQEFDAALHQGRAARDRIAETLEADAERRNNFGAEMYATALKKIDELFEHAQTEAYRIKSSFNRTYITAMDSGDWKHDQAVIDELKEQWGYAPADEMEAMRSAIEHFEKAVASDARLNDPEPFFRSAAVIVDLELRCNDLDGAFRKARGVVASVMKDRQAIVTRISQAENESHKMALKNQLSAANRSIERANDLYAQVVDLVIDREMPRISAILEEHTNKTSGQKKLALLSNGISHGLVTHLEKRQML